MPGMLSYSLNVCMSLLQSRQFRNKVRCFNLPVLYVVVNFLTQV